MSQKQLNAQQAEFARLLAAGSTKMAAYRAAYPGNYNDRSCSAKAARLAKHPLIAPLEAGRAARVRDAVAVAVNRYGITAERVAEAMARLAFTELRQIVDVHSVVVGGQHRRVVDVKDFSDIDGDAHQAIAEVRKTAGGELTVKLFNKREALMDLARLKGWIADKPVDQRSLVMLKIER